MQGYIDLALAVVPWFQSINGGLGKYSNIVMHGVSCVTIPLFIRLGAVMLSLFKYLPYRIVQSLFWSICLVMAVGQVEAQTLSFTQVINRCARAAHFSQVSAVTTDTAGDLFVGDGNYLHRIDAVTGKDTLVLSNAANIVGLAIDANDNIFCVDQRVDQTQPIDQTTVFKVGPDG